MELEECAAILYVKDKDSKEIQDPYKDFFKLIVYLLLFTFILPFYSFSVPVSFSSRTYRLPSFHRFHFRFLLPASQS